MTIKAAVRNVNWKKSADLSRVAALTVSQLILVQSLGKFLQACISETCASLSKTSAYSNQAGVKLDTFIISLKQNRGILARQLEKELMLWFLGRKAHPFDKAAPAELSLMDSETSDIEVLKAKLESQLNDFVRFEITDFQQRWKRVQADAFDPDSGVMTPLYQGLFVVDFIQSKHFPEEISDELIGRFTAGFPNECKKIHLELIAAFQAMGINSGGWEIYNGTERMCPMQQF